jgi:hypothetical protein
MKHRFFWHRKRTLSNFTVIAIDQVGNGFDHAVLLVLRHFGHKTKIKNGKLSISSSHHVTRVLKDEKKRCTVSILYIGIGILVVHCKQLCFLPDPLKEERRSVL